MRALFLKQSGDPPLLEVKDVPTPRPNPHQVLVRVAACGFCHHDRSVMAGVLRRGITLNVVLGHEISGIVEETGSAVTSLRTGDHVVSILTEACGRCDRCKTGREHRCHNGQGIGHGRDGGFAEYAVLTEQSLVRMPEGLDTVSSALLACPLGVALQAVQVTAKVKPGETVVVTGAGGGLGSHAVQAAAGLGANVLAVTSSPEKESALIGLGAAEVLVKSEMDFSELVMALTEDKGSDVVIDTVGSAVYPSTLKSLAQYGRLVFLGEIVGTTVNLNPVEVIFRDATILGTSGVSRATVKRAASMVLSGKIRPVLDLELSLEDAIDGYRIITDRKSTGRVVLRPNVQ